MPFAALLIAIALVGGAEVAPAANVQDEAAQAALGEAPLRAALDEARARLGDHPETAEAARALGKRLYLDGRHDEAEALYRQALAIAGRAGGDDHWSAARAMSDLATLLTDRGAFDEAEALFADALAMSRRLHGQAHEEVALVLELHARMRRARGDYAGAEPMLREALAIRGGVDGEQSAALATTMASLGSLRKQQGELAEAQALLDRALAMQRRVHGPAHRQVATSLELLGELTGAQGRYRSAEPLLREALLIRRTLLGADHPSTAQTIVRLIDVLRAQGKLAEAEALCREAIEIERSVWGDEHLRVASALNRLGGVLNDQARLADAREAIEQALALRERLLPADHPHLATSLNDAGRQRMLLGDLDGAEPLLRRSAEIYAQVWGPEHAWLAAPWCNLADLLGRRGDPASLEEAVDLYERAAAILLAAESPHVHRPWAAHADLLAGELQRPDEAIPLYARAIEQVERLRPGVAGGAIERARYFSSLTRSDAFSGMVRAQVRAGGAEGPAAALRALERGRGRSLLDLLGRAGAAGDAAMQPRAAAEIAAALHAGELLLAYDVSDDGSVLLVMGDDATVEAFELAWPDGVPLRAGDLGRAVRQVVAAASREQDGPPSDDARGPAALRAALLPGALEPRVRSARRVLLVPDGPLNAMPFEMLPAGAGEGRWIDAAPPIVYGASASVIVNRRDVAAARRAAAEARSAPMLVAVGNPRFHVPGDGVSMRGGDAGSRVSHSAALVDQLTPLPASAGEIARIAASVRRAGGADARLLFDERATLAALRTDAPGATFLHLATHGLMDAAGPGQPALAFAPASPSERPCALLGLDELLAEWAGRLDGTRLVTLSACGSALGPMESGDGFVALSWGFLHAGAESVVASLWRVDDTATALLMARFYENMLGAGGDREPMPAADALHEAKRWLRGLTRGELDAIGAPRPALARRRGISYQPEPAREAHPERPFEDPFYWAAFVLTGDGG